MPETVPGPPCGLCHLPINTCTCVDCPRCETYTEDHAMCDACHRCDDCCTCYTCSGCDRRLSREDNPGCDSCDSCEDCCPCYTCSSCHLRRDSSSHSQCAHCNECSNCCDCVSCVHCYDLYDPDSEEYVCSTCNRCEDNHCVCSTCESCGERVRSVCGDCDRCSDCGCNCDSDDDTFVITAVVTTAVVTTAVVGQCAPDEHSFCWSIEEGVIPSVAHNIPGYNVPCDKCHKCTEHCTAIETCPACNTKRHSFSFCTVCGVCDGCCTCLSCHDCCVKHKRSDSCTDCLRCISHCVCPRCATCGSRTIKQCDHCKQCYNCCQSESSDCGSFDSSYPIKHWDPEKVLYQVPYTAKQYEVGGHVKYKAIAGSSGFQVNPSTRFIGVEIETNGVTLLGKGKMLNQAIKKWQTPVKPDGSIGPLPGAFEINLQPACGDLAIEQISDICAGLQKMGASPNDKCGIHVHVDASDILADDLKRVIDVYVRVERALFDLCHPRRLGGSYSVPCGKGYESMGKTGREVRLKIMKNFFGTDTISKPIDGIVRCGRCYGAYKPNKRSPISYCLDCGRPHDYKKLLLKHQSSAGKRLKESKKSGSTNVSRYRALNLVSFFKRRTIEFRHLEGMTSAHDISNWAMTVEQVISASVRMSHNQVSVLPNNSRKALLAVVPERLHGWLVDRWVRMDTIVKSSATYQEKRRSYWGI